MATSEQIALEEAQHRLFRYIRAGRIHHALILASENRATVLSLAKILAKHLLCESKGAALSCDKCSSCRRIEKEIHPDVFYLREEGEENLKIESVRSACHQMEIAPLEGRAKICIIEECHRMSTSSANAFLKTLEEPGVGRYFLLLTSQPGALLPTILSRCVLFSLKPEAQALDGEQEEKFTQSMKEFLRAKNVSVLAPVLSDKTKVEPFVQFIQRHLRSALTAPYSSEKPSLVFDGISSYRLIELFDGTMQLELRSRSNANYGLLVEDYLRQNWL